MMPFSPASIQSIKSVSQRALTLYWNRLAGDRPFPSITEFDPGPGLHDPKQLVIWNIEGDYRQPSFRAVYQGPNVAEVFNSSWAGRTMDEVVPPRLKSVSINGANECAVTGCAIYTIFATFDAQGHRVHCERLLLPLGEGSTAQQIVASLQLISVEGEFERKSVLSQFETLSQVVFAGRIRSGLVTDDGGEAYPQDLVSASKEGWRQIRKRWKNPKRQPDKATFGC